MRLAILLSGRGSNFQAIHEAVKSGALHAEIVLVLSNRPDAPGIERAREYGYDAHVVDHRTFANRAAHEEEVLRLLDIARPDFIVLAGYMRLLSASSKCVKTTTPRRSLHASWNRSMPRTSRRWEN